MVPAPGSNNGGGGSRSSGQEEKEEEEEDRNLDTRHGMEQKKSLVFKVQLRESHGQVCFSSSSQCPAAVWARFSTWEEYWVASFFILQRRGGGDNEDFSLGGFLALSLDHCEVGKAKKPPKLKATGFVIEVMAVSHSRPFPIFCNNASTFFWRISVVGWASPRVFLAPLTASR